LISILLSIFSQLLHSQIAHSDIAFNITAIP
jgi:hypothetical protein